MTKTDGLTNLMQIYYDKVFLERAEADIQYDWGAQKKKLPRNSGKTIYFNRFSSLDKATTALTEGANPAGADMSSTIVSATVAEYGNYTRVSSLFDLTSIDEGLKEHTEVLAFNAAETIDELIKAELSGGGTEQIVSGKALTAVAASDVLTALEIRKAVRTLRKAKAKMFDDGFYHAIIPTSAVYDLRADSVWTAVNTYVSTENYKQWALGALHGVKFMETNNESSQSSTVTVYHTFVFGKNAYGIVDIGSSSSPKMIVKTPGAQDTSNPLNMYSSIGWKVDAFAAKVLNSAWLVTIKSGATA
jgi:N4-gp56 family major capsid protein